MAFSEWVGSSRRRFRWPLPCLPPPPSSSLRETIKLLVIGRLWGQIGGTWPGPSLTLGFARRALQGAGLGAASSSALGISLLGFHPWYGKKMSPRPLARLLQCSSWRHIHHFIFILSLLITYLLGTHYVPGSYLLCASRVAPHKGVASQPPGDMPPPQVPLLHLPGSSMQEKGNSNGRIFSIKTSRPNSDSGAAVRSSKRQERHCVGACF